MENNEINEKVVKLMELLTNRQFESENNIEELHKYLSSLIVDYCERLSELTGESPSDIYNNIKEKSGDTPKKPLSHLTVVK